MKVEAKMLASLIREVVQDELKKSLPGLVKEVLAESYLKKLVRENAAGGPPRIVPTLAELQDEEEDKSPEPLRNNHKGIYQQTPLIKSEGNEVAAKLLSRDNPLAFVYEGVKPIPKDVAPAAPSVPLDNGPLQFDFAKMAEMSRKMEARAAQKKEIVSPEAELRRLEEKRRQLDVPVSVLKE